MYDSKHTFCAIWEEKLTTLCPDDLQPAEREAFDIHVETCQVCASVLADYHKMDALIRDALIAKRPLGLWKVFLSE